MQLFALGMFVFELASLAPDELQRKTDWRFARAPRLGTRDAFQFLGPGDEKISFSGSVYTEIADGPVSLDALRELASTGEVLPLLDGRGTIYGDFIIEAIDERRVAFMGDGYPRRIDFGIDLTRVDEPAEAEAGQGDSAAEQDAA